MGSQIFRGAPHPLLPTGAGCGQHHGCQTFLPAFLSFSPYQGLLEALGMYLQILQATGNLSVTILSWHSYNISCTSEKLPSASLAWLSTQKGTFFPEDGFPSQIKMIIPKIPVFPGKAWYQEWKVVSTIWHVDFLFQQTPSTSKAVIQS